MERSTDPVDDGPPPGDTSPDENQKRGNVQESQEATHYRRSFGDDVRVQVIDSTLVLLVAAHGAVLPEQLAPALDYVAELGVGEPVYTGYFHDTTTDDPSALVHVYTRAVDRPVTRYRGER